MYSKEDFFSRNYRSIYCVYTFVWFPDEEVKYLFDSNLLNDLIASFCTVLVLAWDEGDSGSGHQIGIL